MPLNSLAPAFIKLRYSTIVSAISMTHVMVLPVMEVSDDGDNTLLLRKGATSQLWTTCVDDLVLVLKPLFSAAGVTTFDFADLYLQADANSTPVFTSTHLIAVTATGGTGTVSELMETYSFRSADGGKFKLLLLEGLATVNNRHTYGTLSAAQKALVDFLIGNNSFVHARDNSYLQTFLFQTTKTNDILRKKRMGL